VRRVQDVFNMLDVLELNRLTRRADNPRLGGAWAVRRAAHESLHSAFRFLRTRAHAAQVFYCVLPAHACAPGAAPAPALPGRRGVRGYSSVTLGAPTTSLASMWEDDHEAAAPERQDSEPRRALVAARYDARLVILKALVADGHKKIAAGAEQNVAHIDVRRTNFPANKMSRRPPPEQSVEKVQ
jgi:hypothetical protein